jgi:hypothetical protein
MPTTAPQHPLPVICLEDVLGQKWDRVGTLEHLVILKGISRSQMMSTD